MTGSQQLTPARPRRLVDQPGVRFGIGVAGQLAVGAALTAGRLPAAWGVAALVATTAVLAATLTTGYAALLGVAGWAFADGFALHRYGDLGFTGRELLLLAGFVAASVLAGHW